MFRFINENCKVEAVIFELRRTHLQCGKYGAGAVFNGTVSPSEVFKKIYTVIEHAGLKRGAAGS
jgi:hypothetical protein